MLMFKQFIKENAITGYNTLLNEELNDAQKAVVDSWGENTKAKKISKDAIPEGQDRTYIPLEHPDDNKPVEPHPDVKAHLEKHGYKITDYKGNKAVEPKYGREIRIGKALAATGASKELVSTFNNDPKRAASNSGKLGVVISRHPHDVAGMSTDRGWRSCMSMSTTGAKKGIGAGSNSHYLKHDVQQGTHVAYLVHEHDKEAKQPLARIALKPFQSEDKKDTILRPEESQYGTSDHAFGHTVKKWAETNFPVKDDKIYRKNKKLYNDDQKDVIASPNASLKSKDPNTRAAAFDNSNVSHEHITKGLNDEQAQVQLAAIQHPNATAEHITKALGIDHIGIRAAAIQHPNATAEHITHVLHNDGDDYVRKAALKNKNVTAEHLTHVLNNKWGEDRNVRIAALQHPNLPAKEITKVLNGTSSPEKVFAISNPNATPEHINKALDANNHSDIRQYAIENSHVKLSPEHITKALNDVDPRVRAAAVRRPEATAEHITKGVNDEKSFVRQHAIQNPNANAEHISKILNDPNETDGVKKIALAHPKATPEHITKALRDPDESVRRTAISNPNANAEHITKALSDPDDVVRRRAINHPNANEDHALKASGDSSMFIRNDAEQRLAQFRVANKRKSKEL
jgi:hypothetical protein